MIDVLIPTCKTNQELIRLTREVIATAGCPVHVIATCTDASAAANRNWALKAARSDPRIMIDDDVTGFPRGWVARMVEVMAEYPDCVMLTVELMGLDGKPALMMGDPPRGGTGVAVVPSRKLLTACIAIRANDLLFDERYVGSGFEDDDYSAQLRQRYPRGTWMICHDVRVIHLNEMKNQAEHFDANRKAFQEKWGTQWGKD